MSTEPQYFPSNVCGHMNFQGLFTVQRKDFAALGSCYQYWLEIVTSPTNSIQLDNILQIIPWKFSVFSVQRLNANV